MVTFNTLKAYCRIYKQTLKVHAVEDWFLWHQENNFVNSANSSKELDALAGKRIKFVV